MSEAPGLGPEGGVTAKANERTLGDDGPVPYHDSLFIKTQNSSQKGQDVLYVHYNSVNLTHAHKGNKGL